MQLPAPAAWAWIPIVIGAALSQTVRNAAQRTISSTLGAWPATLVRFLYGIPFAILWLACTYALDPNARSIPDFTWSFAAWLSCGALSQIMATFFLLSAMAQRNFIVGVTFSKTEILQVALFAILFLNEVPTWMSAVAVIFATAGVVLLSFPPRAMIAGSGPLLSPAALLGLASGACFALANVTYRGAALALPGVSPWLIGAWGVVLAQTLQSAVLGSFLEWKQPGALHSILGAWRISLVAGACGALASIGWLTAFALRPAADVRILGLVEVFFSYVVSRRLFGENTSKLELSGMCLVIAGVVLVCL